MDFIELAFSFFLIAQWIRLMVFKVITVNYADWVEVFFLFALGSFVGYMENDRFGEYTYVEAIGAAGLALFLLELYVVALKSSQVSIPRGRI